MGFAAIYMPAKTHADVMAEPDQKGIAVAALNANGTALYRPLADFPVDMGRIVGKSVLAL